MRWKTWLVILPLWLVLIIPASGQTLSTTVFESEDDLFEAFQQGDLSYYEFLALREIIVQGLVEDNRYLLDEIPNLVFIDSQAVDPRTELQLDQLAGFVSPRLSSNLTTLEVDYRYFRGTEEEASSGYRWGAKFELSQQLKGAIRIHGERSGRERIVSRSLEYQNRTGVVRQITLGSYTTRLGLGTIYGRRGSLFDFSRVIDGESFLFPDYGGFNGLNGRFQSGRFEGELVGTVTRDSEHRLSSIGGMVAHPFGKWHGGLIFGSSQLVDTAEARLTDQKVAMNIGRQGRSGSIGVELTRQFGDGGRSGALLIEGKQLLSEATVKVAAWVYGDSFVNLTSGSKAASLSRTVVDSLTGFEFRDRLSGQKGGLLQTRLKLRDGWELTSSVIYGQREFDSSRVEFMGSLKRSFSSVWSVRGDFLSRVRQNGPGSSNRSVDQRSRVELRLKLGKTKARTYIAYQKAVNGTDYWSFFSSVSSQLSGLGELTLWSNIGRITSDGVQYWYVFLKQAQRLSERTKLILKLSNSYSRSRTKQNDTVFSMEIRTGL